LWTGKIKRPSQILNTGDIVDATVLHIDSGKRPVSLGVKQLAPNPLDTIAEKYPVGRVIEGKNKKYQRVRYIRGH